MGNHLPTETLHELLAGACFILLLAASTALSLAGQTLPADLSAILHLSAGWLFGATTTRAFTSSRNGTHP